MSLTEKTWIIRSGSLATTVRAVDQFEAWDTWQTQDAKHFGLVASAEPDESTDPFLVHTATLMRRWDRGRDALLFDARAIEMGLIE